MPTSRRPDDITADEMTFRIAHSIAKEYGVPVGIVYGEMLNIAAQECRNEIEDRISDKQRVVSP